MISVLRVAFFEFRRHLLTGRFILVTFGIPLAVCAVAAVSVIVAQRPQAESFGWILVGDEELPGDWQRSDSEAAAISEVEAGRAGGYVVLQPDGRAEVHGQGAVPPAIARVLEQRALDAILVEAPAETREMLLRPVLLSFVALEATSSRPTAGLGLGMALVLALLVPFVFVTAVMLSTSYMVYGVTEEKVNRVMEILLTSVSHRTLIAGKVLGLGALSALQTGAWIAALGAVGLAVIRRIPGGLEAELPWVGLAASAAYFILGYVLYATLMLGVGVAIGQPREAQQAAGFLSMILVLPFFLVGIILVAPEGPISVALSIFPLSSPVAMPMRLVLAAAPTMQVATGLLVLALTVWLVILGVARVFRATMLLYGQRLRPRELMRAIWS